MNANEREQAEATMREMTAYTSEMPGGRRMTFADIQPGWWVQVYVGSWPYDTVCGYVTTVHYDGSVTADLEDGYGTRRLPRRRLCSTLRPVDG